MKKTLLLVLSFSTGVFGQPLYKGDSLRVDVQVSISIAASGLFRYAYFVHNLDTSPESMENFNVISNSPLFYGQNILGAFQPSHWGLPIVDLNYASWVVERDTNDIFDLDINSPGKWGLQPGDTISFGFLSGVPPGIGKFQALTFRRPVTDNEIDSLAELGYTTDQILVNADSEGYKGVTLTPQNPPPTFNGESWIDTLISYKHQAVTLGWLRDDKSHEQECEETMKARGWYRKEELGKMRSWEVDESWDFDRDWNNGIVGVLDKRLDMAKQALTRGDSVAARRDLQIFVMEVELVNRLGGERGQRSEIRGQKAVMTSEAYALLKYNAEYLIDRLPERHGRGDEGQRRGRK